MPTPPVTVKLGEASYVLVPQRHARIKRELGSLFETLEDGDATVGGLMGLIGDKLYEVCSIFIRDLMPREQWEDEEIGPTFPEIEDAILKGAKVNGLDRISSLGKIISPEMIRALIQSRLIPILAGDSPSPSSSKSPSPSGEPTSTPSLTSVPTDPSTSAPPDGPSSESPISSPAETFAAPLNVGN